MRPPRWFSVSSTRDDQSHSSWRLQISWGRATASVSRTLHQPSKIISCGDESWLASVVSCGLPCVVPCQISWYPPRSLSWKNVRVLRAWPGFASWHRQSLAFQTGANLNTGRIESRSLAERQRPTRRVFPQDAEESVHGSSISPPRHAARKSGKLGNTPRAVTMSSAVIQ